MNAIDRGSFEVEGDLAAAQRRRRRTFHSLSTVMDFCEEFPILFRDDMELLAREMLRKLEDAAHDLLCAHDHNDYRGLDINRDTKEEVETLITRFPRILSRRRRYNTMEEGTIDFYPIQILPILQCHDANTGDITYRWNVHAAPFIPILAQLGTQLGQFEERQRGGLLLEYENGLTVLQHATGHLPDDVFENTHEFMEYRELRDNQKVDILKQLREMILFRKEDIKQYDLLACVCSHRDSFPEELFRFLVEWDPDALALPRRRTGNVPLHIAAKYQSVEGFRFVLKAGVTHFSLKQGLNFFFHKNRSGKTPLQYACKKHGRDEVMNLVEQVLIDCSDNPYNPVEALVGAAIDENIALDGVYFILRRQPDILQTLLSPSLTNNSNMRDSCRNGHFGHNSSSGSGSNIISTKYGDGNGDVWNEANNHVSGRTRSAIRKRKRDSNSGDNEHNEVDLGRRRERTRGKH